MKKSITILLALLLCTTAAVADEREKGKNTIAFGTGVLTLGETSNIFSMIGTALFSGDQEYEHSGGTGLNLFGEYKYTINRTYSIGAVATWNSYNYRVMESGEQVGSRTNKYMTLALENDFTYWSKGIFSIYGTLGVGFYHSIITDKDTAGQSDRRHNNSVSYQITPVGITLGGRLGGFFEVGIPWIGYKGMLSGGIYYNF